MAEYDKIRINTMEEAAAGIIDAGRITPKKLAHAIRERAQAKLVQGANITIDNTDPDAPVISATGGGGGAVDSVNGETGDVTGLQWQLTEGSGIDINNASPKSPVISANAQEILNTISATQGVVLFRGASGWEALGPGASGQVLGTQGPAANPLWVDQTGGGGGGDSFSYPAYIRGNPTGSFGVIQGGILEFNTFSPTVSNTNNYTKISRRGVGGSLGGNGFSQCRGQDTFCTEPSVFEAAFGYENVPSSSRILVGFQAGWSGGQEITAGTNVIGFGKDSADTNLQIISRGTGAVTKIDLGPNFPGSGINIGFKAKMEFLNTGTVSYEIINLNTLATVSGTFSANIPDITVRMYGGVWFATGVAQTVQGSLIGWSTKPSL